MNRFVPLIFGALFLLATHTSAQEKIETWRMMELKFSSVTDYSEAGADGVWMDVEFIHESTRQSLVRPAFWDGKGVFIVRFAPTQKGKWSYMTRCEQDTSLDNISGSFKCVPYQGDLEIYKRGFVLGRQRDQGQRWKNLETAVHQLSV